MTSSSDRQSADLREIGAVFLALPKSLALLTINYFSSETCLGLVTELGLVPMDPRSSTQGPSDPGSLDLGSSENLFGHFLIRNRPDLIPDLITWACSSQDRLPLLRFIYELRPSLFRNFRVNSRDLISYLIAYSGILDCVPALKFLQSRAVTSDDLDRETRPLALTNRKTDWFMLQALEYLNLDPSIPGEKLGENLSASGTKYPEMIWRLKTKSRIYRYLESRSDPNDSNRVDSDRVEFA